MKIDEYVKYENIHKYTGKSKFLLFLGWLFIICGILVFVTSIVTWNEWKKTEKNYEKEYVYNENGDLYYEKGSERTYIETIYNSDKEKITLNIPIAKTIIMYISKNNPTEGIYVDLNNSNDTAMLSPVSGIVVSLILFVMGSYPILANKEAKEGKRTFRPVFFIYLALFISGVVLVGMQINKGVNYLKLKNQNNITTATINSEMYVSSNDDLYKPVAYYFVNGQKYIYVSDYFENGTLDKNFNKTFDLYYDSNNPNVVSRLKDPINIELLIIGMIFLVINGFLLIKINFKEETQI